MELSARSLDRCGGSGRHTVDESACEDAISFIVYKIQYVTYSPIGWVYFPVRGVSSSTVTDIMTIVWEYGES